MNKITKADIFKEFARIEELREGTSLQLKDLFKYNGEYPQEESYSIVPMIGEPYNYTFALTLVEGKPAFVGDSVWHSDYKQYVNLVGLHIHSCYAGCKWNEPTTFELNNKILPLPNVNPNPEADSYYIDVYMMNIKKYKWKNLEDRDKVINEIQIFLDNLLSGESKL
jgi:hypothetical protein